MRLYNIPKGSRIKTGSEGEFIIFDHVDGMYSYCYPEGEPEKVCHLHASTNLKKVGDYYEIEDIQ